MIVTPGALVDLPSLEPEQCLKDQVILLSSTMGDFRGHLEGEGYLREGAEGTGWLVTSIRATLHLFLIDTACLKGIAGI